MLSKKKLKSYLTGMMFILFLAVLLNSIAAFAHKAILQQGIAEEVLRFHVLANSDTEADQAVKLEVRDGVLEWISGEIELYQDQMTSEQEIEISNYELANDEKIKMERFLEENLEEIEDVADQILENAGMPYHAVARIEQCYFPDRTYGDCTFPAGWYEALRICLGEAEGQNWWCVLYPKLCFADYMHVVDEDGLKKLEEVLSVEEYESLLKTPKKWRIGFRWF